MLVFAEEGKPENLEKNLRNKARTNNKLNPHAAQSWNQTIVSFLLDVLNVEYNVPSDFHNPPTETHLIALGTAGIAQYQSK